MSVHRGSSLHRRGAGRNARTPRGFAALGLLAVTAGCATTTLTAFRDSAHPKTRFEKVAIFALGMRLDAAVEVERQVCARLAPRPCAEGKVLFPPTRRYSPEEAQEQLRSAAVDGVLIIALLADQADSKYVGAWTSGTSTQSTTSTGTINLYGNTAYWSGVATTTGTANAVSLPAYRTDRLALAHVALFERSTGSLAWGGELKVTGSAMASTDKEFIRAATARVAAELKALQLVP